MEFSALPKSTHVLQFGDGRGFNIHLTNKPPNHWHRFWLKLVLDITVVITPKDG